MTWRSVPNFSMYCRMNQTDAAIRPIITTLVTISEAQTKSHIDIWLAVFTTSGAEYEPLSVDVNLSILELPDG